MKWFLTKYIYEIVSGSGNYGAQFDEQFRLIEAPDIHEALDKAEALAEKFHLPFENCRGEMVTWKFICIADIHEIQVPQDGAEVASILHEPADTRDFLEIVARRRDFTLKLITRQSFDQQTTCHP